MNHSNWQAIYTVWFKRFVSQKSSSSVFKRGCAWRLFTVMFFSLFPPILFSRSPLLQIRDCIHQHLQIRPSLLEKTSLKTRNSQNCRTHVTGITLRMVRVFLPWTSWSGHLFVSLHLHCSWAGESACLCICTLVSHITLTVCENGGVFLSWICNSCTGYTKNTHGCVLECSLCNTVFAILRGQTRLI